MSLNMQQIERQAASYARDKGLTREQAFTKLLEENPSAYAEFLKQHNAKAITEPLMRAGFIRAESEDDSDSDEGSKGPRFCSSCGAKVRMDAKFCHACGAKLPAREQ